MENVLDKTLSYEKHIPFPASAATTFVKIADNQKVEMLLLKMSDSEKKLSNVCEALKKNFMAPFYGRSSTASRLQPLRGGSLLFIIQFPEIHGTHFINLRRMKC